MARITEGLKQFFFIDQHSGTISYSKFFAILGCIEILIMFPLVVFLGVPVDVSLWGTVGALLIANRRISKMGSNGNG